MVVHGPYPVGEPRVAREVRAALAAGFAVDVVALRRPGEPAREAIGGADVIRLPIRHRRGGGALRTVFEYVGFTLAASLRVAVLALHRRYAVVQVHNPPDFLIAAGLVPKLLGARLVLDIHDLSPDMFAMRFGGRRGSHAADRALRAVERAAAAVADAVVTVHEPYRRELESRGVPAEKLTVVMNSVDDTLLPPPAPPDPGFRIVYHGTVTPSYGVHLLVEALALLAPSVPDATLEIYGDGDALPELRALAEARGVTGRMRADGVALPHREVLARVSGAAVGVVPNLPSRLNRFALSSKLFEYVALGLPVVSAELPTIREHFGPDEVAFFAPGDAASLAAELAAVAAAPEGAAARAAAASRRAEAYGWRVSAGRYVELLARLTDEPRPTLAPARRRPPLRVARRA